MFRWLERWIRRIVQDEIAKRNPASGEEAGLTREQMSGQTSQAIDGLVRDLQEILRQGGLTGLFGDRIRRDRPTEEPESPVDTELRTVAQDLALIHRSQKEKQQQQQTERRREIQVVVAEALEHAVNCLRNS